MNVTRLDADFGAEVKGLDATRPLTSEQGAELKDAFLRHRLLLFRDQKIDNEAHVRLVEAICPILREGDTGEDYNLVTNDPKVYVAGTSPINFHSDYLFTPQGPNLVVSLCALVMELDEPTMFVDNVAALQRMPSALVEKLRGLDVVQCQAVPSGLEDEVGATRNRVSWSEDRPPGTLATATSPAIRKHPLTGEETLMISENMTSHFDGMSEEESDPLLAEVSSYQYNQEYVYTHHWQVGDLLMWDNIAVQHGRKRISTTSGRTLRRVVGNPNAVVDSVGFFQANAASAMTG